MLQEASIDEAFNRQLGKIQDAIDELQKIHARFEKENVKPVSTQVTALRYAAEDMEKLHKMYDALKSS